MKDNTLVLLIIAGAAAYWLWSKSQSTPVPVVESGPLSKVLPAILGIPSTAPGPGMKWSKDVGGGAWVQIPVGAQS